MKKGNRIIFFSFFWVTFFSYTISTGQSSHSQKKRDYLDERVLDNLNYDTLDVDFYQEVFIQPYTIGDEIVKYPNFIKMESAINKNSYMKGYFACSFEALKRFKLKNPGIKYDSSSVAKLYFEKNLAFMGGDSTRWADTTVICNSIYKKVHLKIEVLSIGSCLQMIPLFFTNCDDYHKYMKTHKKDYEMASLPTYLITNVFQFKAIK